MTSVAREKFLAAILLVAILALAAILRFDRARSDGLTFDEIWHVELSTGRGSQQIVLPTNQLIAQAPALTSLRDAPPIWNVWTNMNGVVHPPLFVTMLRIWRTIFGESDLAAKSLSIVCSLIAIVLLHEAIRTHTSVAAARWAAAIFAIAPAQIYLSQEVRGYAIAQMLACGVILAVVRIERLGASRARLLALTICAASLALTHYFGVLALLAIGVYVLIRFRDRMRRDSMLALVGAAAIFTIAWGPFVWRLRGTISQMADPWLSEPAMSFVSHARLTLGRMLALPVRQIAEPTNPIFQWPLIVGGLILIGAIALVWFRRDRRDLLIWLVWLAGTLLAVALLDLFRRTRQLGFPRYTSLAAPAIIALLASLCPPKHVLPIIAIAVAIIAHPTVYNRDDDDEPDWRRLGTAIDQHCKPDEPLVFYSGGQVFWYHEILLLASSHYSHAFPRDILRITSAPVAIDRDTAWIISGPLDRSVEQVIPGATVTEQYFLPSFAVLTRVRLSPR
jgi:uncharacterized membrane protein